MLTVQILTKNNEAILKRCLDSLAPLSPKIIIADLGSTDKTLEIAKGCEIVKADDVSDRSKIRNALQKRCSTKWSMYIEPDEAIVSDHDKILEALTKDGDAYKLRILRGDILTKEVRIWKKGQFIRPIYEGLDLEAPALSSLICGEMKFDYKSILASLDKWRTREPTSHEPYYYLALTNLGLGRYRSFITAAEHYLFCCKAENESTILLKYYLALVEIKVTGNHAKGTKHLLACLAWHPLFAEFWCLLGDMFLGRSDPKRATLFYKNAMYFGSKRDLNDTSFVEISKYEEYPAEMLAKVNRACSADAQA